MCEAAQDLETLSVDVLNETTFQACDYECTQWGTKGDHVIVPKGGIMASHFIGEKHEYLQLSDEEFEATKSREKKVIGERAKKDTVPQKN